MVAHQSRVSAFQAHVFPSLSPGFHLAVVKAGTSQWSGVLEAHASAGRAGVSEFQLCWACYFPHRLPCQGWFFYGVESPFSSGPPRCHRGT